MADLRRVAKMRRGNSSGFTRHRGALNTGTRKRRAPPLDGRESRWELAGAISIRRLDGIRARGPPSPRPQCGLTSPATS